MAGPTEAESFAPMGDDAEHVRRHIELCHIAVVKMERASGILPMHARQVLEAGDQFSAHDRYHMSEKQSAANDADEGAMP